MHSYLICVERVIWLEDPGNCLGVNDWFPAKGPWGFWCWQQGTDVCLELVGGELLSLSLRNGSLCSPCSHSPCSPDEYLDLVTFICVIHFTVPVTGWFLGFNHHLQEIHPALRRKAGEFLWWQVLQGGLAQTASRAQALLLNWKCHHDAHWLPCCKMWHLLFISETNLSFLWKHWVGEQCLKWILGKEFKF